MRCFSRKILIRLGGWLSYILPYRNESELFFFFPFYHVGGAERVHADILTMASGRNPWIVITNRSNNPVFRERFVRAGKLFDISSLVSNPVLQIVVIGYFAAIVNKCRKALVFSSNTPFFYSLLPYLCEDIYCVDLIHAFGGGLEKISLPFVERIDRRIVITRKTYEDLQQQYRLNGLNSKLVERVDVVENKVNVPAVLPHKVNVEKLRILYVGRGSEEKRVHLVGKAARFCHNKGLPVDFTLVGDVLGAVDASDRHFCRFMGELQNSTHINELYSENDILLVTSSREGFPLVIMEAMAHGIVPLSTDVGGIHCHVRNGENGFLVENSANENEIVASVVALIEKISGNRELLGRLSGAAYEYAAAHFTGERFDRYYLSLFMECRVVVGRFPDNVT